MTYSFIKMETTERFVLSMPKVIINLCYINLGILRGKIKVRVIGAGGIGFVSTSPDVDLRRGTSRSMILTNYKGQKVSGSKHIH